MHGFDLTTIAASKRARIIEIMNNKHQIILDYAEIPKLVEKYRSQGKKIVLTQGSFDMIHIGHGRYCEEAKKYGDVLFVGVDSDEKVRSRKGPDRPVVPQEERLEMLTYFESVSHVVLKDLKQPKWELIKLLSPDILITTRETYSPKKIKELEEICGKVVVLEPMATTSTSAKLRRVQMGVAKNISATLSKKLIASIEGVLDELKTQSK
jgi:D-glycero-beta-D-manno-heptose 1-phosphate adenylyltransferase